MRLWWSGEGSYGAEWNQIVEDLAMIDAHSATMARSVHYNVSDEKTRESVIKKKTMRAYVAVMKALPLDRPVDRELEE